MFKQNCEPIGGPRGPNSAYLLLRYQNHEIDKPLNAFSHEHVIAISNILGINIFGNNSRIGGGELFFPFAH